MILILHLVRRIEIIAMPGRDDDHERRTEGKYNSAYGMNDVIDVGCIDTKHDMMYWHEAWHDDVIAW